MWKIIWPANSIMSNKITTVKTKITLTRSINSRTNWEASKIVSPNFPSNRTNFKNNSMITLKISLNSWKNKIKDWKIYWKMRRKISRGKSRRDMMNKRERELSKMKRITWKVNWKKPRKKSIPWKQKWKIKKSNEGSSRWDQFFEEFFVKLKL